MGIQWDKVVENIKNALSVSTEKIEEYSHIGKVRIDISFTKRNLARYQRELGEKVFFLLEVENGTGIADNPDVVSYAEKIKNTEQLLRDLEQKLEEANKSIPAQKETVDSE